jgi:hypothetical protein
VQCTYQYDHFFEHIYSLVWLRNRCRRLLQSTYQHDHYHYFDDLHHIHQHDYNYPSFSLLRLWDSSEW